MSSVMLGIEFLYVVCRVTRHIKIVPTVPFHPMREVIPNREPPLYSKKSIFDLEPPFAVLSATNKVYYVPTFGRRTDWG